MKLEIADIVGGSESPAPDGTTGATRCVLVVPGGAKRAAILKRGEVQEIVAESFCALLLRAWGLDVPDPYLVRLKDRFGFGSAEVSYPSLKQRMGLNGSVQDARIRDRLEAIACEVAAGFSSLPLALSADEAIGNRDRNLGNILWDGQRETWIDHAYCLGGGAALADANKLALMAIKAGKGNAVAKSAVTQSLLLDREAIQLAGAETDKHFGDTGAAEFVAERIAALGMRVLARFPSPADLLSRPQ